MTTATTLKQSRQWAIDSRSVMTNLQRGRAMVFRGDKEQADDLLFTAQDTLQRLMGGQASAGVLVFDESASSAKVEPIGLDQLDTPDTRDLLATLERALQIAERVDSARGRSVGDKIALQPGEPAGCDLAESVALLVLRLRREVGGAFSPHE